MSHYGMANLGKKIYSRWELARISANQAARKLFIRFQGFVREANMQETNNTLEGCLVVGFVITLAVAGLVFFVMYAPKM